MNINKPVSLFGVVELYSHDAFIVKICADIICKLQKALQSKKGSVEIFLFVNYIRFVSFCPSLKRSKGKKIYFDL